MGKIMFGRELSRLFCYAKQIKTFVLLRSPLRSQFPLDCATAEQGRNILRAE